MASSHHLLFTLGQTVKVALKRGQSTLKAFQVENLAINMTNVINCIYLFQHFQNQQVKKVRLEEIEKL